MLNDLFAQFVRERRYLKAVSDKTVIFYEQGWGAFRKVCTGEEITKADLVNFIVSLTDRGVKPVSINTYTRALNAFFNWAHTEGHLPSRLVFQKLKEEQVAIPSLDENTLRILVSFKPRTFGQHRLHALICLLIDTGIRIDEALTLTRSRFDPDNCLITVKGKGGKERIVPFSPECRKVLWKYLGRHKHELIFPTRHGGKLTYRNLVREYKELKEKLKLPKEGSFHRLRHTFALNYVRNGGSLFHLQKQLGHSTLTMTRRYTELETRDLQDSHKSILSKLR